MENTRRNIHIKNCDIEQAETILMDRVRSQHDDTGKDVQLCKSASVDTWLLSDLTVMGWVKEAEYLKAENEANKI